MRLVFLGTPSAAVPALEALVEAGHEVALVITEARPKTRPGFVALTQPGKAEGTRPRPSRRPLGEGTRWSEAEWGVVVAYGAMIPASVLAVTPMLNVHFSLLPRWRGAAPVERAILAGDVRSGVCVMSLEATLTPDPCTRERVRTWMRRLRPGRPGEFTAWERAPADPGCKPGAPSMTPRPRVRRL